VVSTYGGVQNPGHRSEVERPEGGVSVSVWYHVGDFHGKEQMEPGKEWMDQSMHLLCRSPVHKQHGRLVDPTSSLFHQLPVQPEQAGSSPHVVTSNVATGQGVTLGR
jgi:hypothetical protein